MPETKLNLIAGEWLAGESEIENRNPSDLNDLVGLFEFCRKIDSQPEVRQVDAHGFNRIFNIGALRECSPDLSYETLNLRSGHSWRPVDDNLGPGVPIHPGQLINAPSVVRYGYHITTILTQPRIAGRCREAWL